MTVSLDGSGSSDLEGSIVSYSWDYGDGSPLGSGVTSSHIYNTPGTYTVTLTVSDGSLTGTVRPPQLRLPHKYSVHPPHRLYSADRRLQQRVEKRH